MIYDDFPLELINNWNVRTLSKDSLIFDVIVLNIGENKIDIPLFFSRSKNLCFNDSFNDYCFHYSKNISYIKEMNYLKSTIPHRYTEHETWQYQYDKYLHDRSTNSRTPI